jgi:hypothetical protein
MVSSGISRHAAYFSALRSVAVIATSPSLGLVHGHPVGRAQASHRPHLRCAADDTQAGGISDAASRVDSEKQRGEDAEICPSLMTRGSHKRSTIGCAKRQEREQYKDVAGPAPAARQLPLRPEPALVQRNTSMRARAS